MYIVFDGVDKTGKSTMVDKIGEFLLESDYETVIFKEPLNLRDKILEVAKWKDFKYKDEILICLFAADRLMIKEEIEKHLQKGTIVISDRSMFSSFAYQGNLDFNIDVNAEMIFPDLIINLDSDPDFIFHRGAGEDSFETREQITRARWNYRHEIRPLCKEWGIKFEIVKNERDFNKAFEKVQKIIVGELHGLSRVY
jgi:dTMP kinase